MIRDRTRSYHASMTEPAISRRHDHNGVRQACALALIMVGLGVAGCQVHMPNTGIRTGEYTALLMQPEDVELTGGGTAALGSKVAGEAAKLVAKLADKALESLQERYTGTATAGYANDRLGGEADEGTLVFVRGVRMTLDQLKKQNKTLQPGASDPVIQFFERIKSDDDFRIRERDDNGHLLNHGWYIDKRTGRTMVQFVTTRLTFGTQTQTDSSQNHALRLTSPKLEVWATEALLPAWDKIVDEFRKELNLSIDEIDTELERSDLKAVQRKKLEKTLGDLNLAKDELDGGELDKAVSGRLGKLLDDAAREELDMKMTVALTVTAPTKEGPQVELARFSGIVGGIWPIDTTYDDDEESPTLRPAISVSLSDYDTLWIGTPTENYSIRVTVSETSKMEEWIKKLREALNEKGEKKKGE